MTPTEQGWKKHFVKWFTKTEDGDWWIFCTLERRWLELTPINAFEGDESHWIYRKVPSYDK